MSPARSLFTGAALAPTTPCSPTRPRAGDKRRPAGRCHARALEKSPDDPRAIANLAQVYYQQRRYKEAIPLFRRIARMPDPPASILANLGVSLRCAGDPAAAEPYLVRATKLAPNLPGPWRDLGICRAETAMGQRPLALAPPPPPDQPPQACCSTRAATNASGIASTRFAAASSTP
ncbi:MAG: tetratricopeptide repeat protein [Betaproteobacteria bacterium]|nr:tetratricopeptide repeat protein [Betaproteobacteria bacterium]